MVLPDELLRRCLAFATVPSSTSAIEKSEFQLIDKYSHVNTTWKAVIGDIPRFQYWRGRNVIGDEADRAIQWMLENKKELDHILKNRDIFRTERQSVTAHEKWTWWEFRCMILMLRSPPMLHIIGKEFSESHIDAFLQQRIPPKTAEVSGLGGIYTREWQKGIYNRECIDDKWTRLLPSALWVLERVLRANIAFNHQIMTERSATLSQFRSMRFNVGFTRRWLMPSQPLAPKVVNPEVYCTWRGPKEEVTSNLSSHLSLC